MQVYYLDSTNSTALSTNYDLDANLSVKRNTFNTENGLTLHLENALKNVNDFVINNFSSLTLTTRDNLNNALNIDSLDPLTDEIFTTYLAANSLYGFNNSSRFWRVEEPASDINVAAISVSGTQDSINNSYYFEIIFLDDFKCKVAHENDGIKRYLTNTPDNTLVFAKDADLDYLDVYSPQIFLYVYDRENDLITFFKNLNDIIYYVGYDKDLYKLLYVPTITATGFNFTYQTTFKCEGRQETSNATPLFDPWAAYEPDASHNINLNVSKSFDNVPGNLLLNNQFVSISSNNNISLKTNFLSLKNTNTSENYQSRSNPFFDEKECLQRDFRKLFTGSNQELGNDNITLGYETYTDNIILKKDKVTYFHVPQNMYPFKQLNLNDSKLAESGAIAADHPIKSDKIFKKKANYKFSSNFGNSKLENSGSFLCSWLSGNSNFNDRPVWVDRYYFPSQISFLDALNLSPYDAVRYISNYDCLKNSIPPTVPVVDKLSDSIFEPGTLYAYHHVGEQYSRDYIKYLEPYLVQEDFNFYYNTNGSQGVSEAPGIYVFNGSQYCVSNNLSSINQSNEFTMMFDMHSNDWQKPFGYQILGNYSTDGFGVFNTNYLTPAFFISSSNSILVTNTDFETLNTIELNAAANAIIRLDSFDDFYVITNDGYFRKYNNRYNLLYKKFNPNFEKIYDYDYDSENAFVLCNTSPYSASKLFKITLNDGTIEEITDTNDEYNFYFYNVTLSSIVFSKTINKRDNSLYLTGTDKAERFNKNIYLKTSQLSAASFVISKWNTENNSVSDSSVLPVLSVYNSLEDYELDTDGNLWVLYDKYKLAQVNTENVVTLSASLPSATITSTAIDFDYEIENNALKKYILVAALSSTQAIVYKVDSTNGQVLSTFNTKLAGPCLTSLTQSSNLRYNFSDLYVGNKLNTKLKLKNFVNSADVSNINLFYSLSALTPGYHNFCYRFNSTGGTFHFIVDGKIEHTAVFDPKKYAFSNIIDRPFFFGTGIYSNSVPLFEYLGSNKLNTQGIKIKNFSLYNQALNYFDILHVGRSKYTDTVQDIVFDMPCGRRNYLEEIERYFKFRSPGNKSQCLNIVLKNSGINNLQLKNELEKRILGVLSDAAPAHVKINTIKWVN